MSAVPSSSAHASQDTAAHGDTITESAAPKLGKACDRSGHAVPVSDLCVCGVRAVAVVCAHNRGRRANQRAENSAGVLLLKTKPC